jgi:D-amino-acid dehydrogenase
MADRRIIVVGGGMIGVCCAYFLARRGASVTIVERGELGAGASFGNAGCIAPGHTPLNTPTRKRRVLRQLLDPKSPLYIPPRWDPALARWLMTFRAHCTEERLDTAMRVLSPLGRASLDLFDELVETERLECEYRRTGYYEVCRTEGRLRDVRLEARLVRRYGFSTDSIEGGALQEREPGLRARMEGALYYPEAATCDPHRLVLELAERARSHGARFHTGTAVTGVRVRSGTAAGVDLHGGEILEADAVILATGAYSPGLTRGLGLRLPVQPGKGYHRDMPTEPGGEPLLGITCVLSETSVFCTPLEGFLRLAGTLEFSGINHDLRRARLDQLTDSASLYLGGLGAGPPSSEWCGLRSCTPDGLPIVGPVPGIEGVFVATGHAMMGLTLGPVTGRLVAEYVLDGRPSQNVEALGADRF